MEDKGRAGVHLCVCVCVCVSVCLCVYKAPGQGPVNYSSSYLCPLPKPEHCLVFKLYDTVTVSLKTMQWSQLRQKHRFMQMM